MASPNPFAFYANHVAPRSQRTPRVRIFMRDSEAPIKLSAADKAVAEREKLLDNYVRIIKQRQQEILNGPHAAELRRLPDFLFTMTMNSADALLHGLESHNWYAHCDVGTRRVLLAMIDTAIMRCRVRNGLAPISDSLPGEPATVFEIIRARFNCEVQR